MNLNLTYIDENGNHVEGEFLYETKIGDKRYALCNLHYGPDNNTVCACKIVGNGENESFIALDNTDNLEAIMAEFNQLLMGEE